MAEWLKDHMAAIGYLKTQHFGLLAKIWLKWRGQLVGKDGEWVCGKLAPPRL
jgi:hypothetical protein